MLIIVEAPFLLLALAAGGTDGKNSSALKIAAIILPIAICSAYAIYRLVTAERLEPIDWLAITVAFIPTLYVLFFVVKKYGS